MPWQVDEGSMVDLFTERGRAQSGQGREGNGHSWVWGPLMGMGATHRSGGCSRMWWPLIDLVAIHGYGDRSQECWPLPDMMFYPGLMMF